MEKISSNFFRKALEALERYNQPGLKNNDEQGRRLLEKKIHEVTLCCVYNFFLDFEGFFHKNLSFLVLTTRLLKSAF